MYQVQGSLDAIPYPDSHFDLVWSFEVLEHIPSQKLPAVAHELARVSRGTLAMTISQRLAGADDPDAPHLHVTCRPRAWWDNLFADAGCVPHLELLAVLWRRELGLPLASQDPAWAPLSEPWIFAYECKFSPNAAWQALSMMRGRVAGKDHCAGLHQDISEAGWCEYFSGFDYYGWTEDCMKNGTEGEVLERQKTFTDNIKLKDVEVFLMYPDTQPVHIENGMLDLRVEITGSTSLELCQHGWTVEAILRPLKGGFR